MTVVKREIPEEYQSISRPVAFDVARQVLIHLGLDPATKITFNGEAEQPLTHGSTLTKEDNNPVRFSGSPRLFIDLKEKPRKNSWFKTNYSSPVENHIFLNSKHNVKIYPIQDEKEATLKLGFRFANKADARKCLSFLRNRLAMLQKEITTTAIFHYPLPHDFITRLRTIHENVVMLEEDLGKPVTSYEDWFTKGITDAHFDLTDAGGTTTVDAIEVKATGIKGGFLEDLKTDVEKGDVSYTVMLDFKYFYSKPIACVMAYPMFIANNVLPEEVRGARRDTFIQEIDNVDFNSTQTNFVRLNEKASPFNTWYGETIPEWDEWISPMTSYAKEIRLFNCMLKTDLSDPKQVINILDIFDGYDIKDYIIDFLKANHKTLTTPYANPFQIALWDDNERIDSNSYYVDENLMLWHTEGLNPEKRYHVTVGLESELHKLVQTMVNNLREHGDVAKTVVDIVDPYLNPPMQIMRGNYVTRQEWSRCTQSAFKVNPNASANKAALKTVMNFTIQSRS